MKNQSGKFLVQVLALSLGIACTQSSPAQSFKKVKVAGSAPIVQVASGGVSVWADDIGVKSKRDAITMPTASDDTAISSA